VNFAKESNVNCRDEKNGESISPMLAERIGLSYLVKPNVSWPPQGFTCGVLVHHFFEGIVGVSQQRTWNAESN
jgi:hypothetical protein